ncbi:MAG: hypothetical protein ACYDD1_09645 [Caulobacteraceae bacterium]
MKSVISAFALIAGLGLAGAASAQAVTSGGPDAKGNAPIKAVHTVNDGSAKRGANSFTEGQARQHILNSGFSDVTGLTNGADGVWRGVAMKNGVSTHVGMDFKGNVSNGGPVVAVATNGTTSTGQPAVDPALAAPTTTTTVHHHGRRRHHHHWRRHHVTGDGVAKSGIDRNHNGISDKEDRALAH